MSDAADTAIFALGRQASAAARQAFGGQGHFASARRLRPDGAWVGPHEAAWALVEERALWALGGPAAARRAGINTLVCDIAGNLAAVSGTGMGCLLRIPFSAGEPDAGRVMRLQRVRDVLRRFPLKGGLVPVPTGEAQGLDTVQFFASCRLALPAQHLVADLDLLGHKLGQLCLSFGADAILGAIVRERALRLGAKAASRELTPDEAVAFLRAAQLVPCEWLPDGKVNPL